MRWSRAFRSSLVNFHSNRVGDLFVVLLEVEQAGLDLVEGVESLGEKTLRCTTHSSRGPDVGGPRRHSGNLPCSPGEG